MALILRNAKILNEGANSPPVDIGVKGGKIAALEPNLAAEGPEQDVGGMLVSPGLVESAHVYANS
ncbi:MAG: hypothetical protein HOI95_28810 [Chromatiales bacterium]|jgi:cytosine/creatinine deaminase|nr:hypothetical protein [Chromatiales bacterium]